MKWGVFGTWWMGTRAVCSLRSLSWTWNIRREFPYCPWEMPRNMKNNYSHSYDVNWISLKLLFVRYHLRRVCSSFISREVVTTYIFHTYSTCASSSFTSDKKRDGETRQNRSFFVFTYGCFVPKCYIWVEGCQSSLPYKRFLYRIHVYIYNHRKASKKLSYTRMRWEITKTRYLNAHRNVFTQTRFS